MNDRRGEVWTSGELFWIVMEAQPHGFRGSNERIWCLVYLSYAEPGERWQYMEVSGLHATDSLRLTTEPVPDTFR